MTKMQPGAAPANELDFTAGKLPTNDLVTQAQKLVAALQGSDPVTQRLLRDQIPRAAAMIQHMRESLGASRLQEDMTLKSGNGRATILNVDNGHGKISIRIDAWDSKNAPGIKQGEILELSFRNGAWRSDTINDGSRGPKYQVTVKNYSDGQFHSPELAVAPPNAPRIRL